MGSGMIVFAIVVLGLLGIISAYIMKNTDKRSIASTDEQDRIRRVKIVLDAEQASNLSDGINKAAKALFEDKSEKPEGMFAMMIDHREPYILELRIVGKK